MSKLEYFAYPGLGVWARTNMGYNQAVRVGDRIECSGQGGWLADTSSIKFPENIEEEINQAFRNVETALKDARGKGWTQVFRVNSYHTNLTPEVTAIMTANFRKYMPDHQPIWTEIGVTKLGADGMNVEIEVSAYDPEGAQAKVQS